MRPHLPDETMTVDTYSDMGYICSVSVNRPRIPFRDGSAAVAVARAIGRGGPGRFKKSRKSPANNRRKQAKEQADYQAGNRWDLACYGAENLRNCWFFGRKKRKRKFCGMRKTPLRFAYRKTPASMDRGRPARWPAKVFRCSPATPRLRRTMWLVRQSFGGCGRDARGPSTPSQTSYPSNRFASSGTYAK